MTKRSSVLPVARGTCLVLALMACLAFRPSSAVAGPYAGAVTCQGCHTENHGTWAQTRHAGALATLKSRGQDKNPACLRCHTVGFGLGGYVADGSTENLGGVQCESCHGAAAAHAANPGNASLVPPKSMSADVCGQCHVGTHQPAFEEWSQTRHSRVNDEVGGRLQTATIATCGPCHSGDYRQKVVIEGGTAPADLLKGTPVEDMNAVTCAVCHDPHGRTGFAAYPEAGSDYQLRYPEVKNPSPSNRLADTINPARFNLCGQCHHTRDATWQSTSRGPHHSVQANFFNGEMPVPDGTQPLAENTPSAMRDAPKQCATCHMRREEFVSNAQPAVKGHRFEVTLASCVANGCHESASQAAEDKNVIQGKISQGLIQLYARLGDPAKWEYSAQGGPATAAGQAAIPDGVKKARFMYYYVLNDGSFGVHNPEYAKKILEKANEFLDKVRRR